jgi:hypothetical protein
MQRIAHTLAIASATWAQSTTQVIDLNTYGSPDLVGLSVIYANGTTGAKTFTVLSQANDTLTMTAHGQVTGSLGQCTTTGGLPTGLSTSTNYYVIVVDANTIKLATSLANAVAGTAVDITGAGTGVQTFTPSTSSGNAIKAQFSYDGVNGTDITTTNFPTCPSATVTVSTSTGVANWDLQRPSFRYILIVYTPSAGQITFSVAIDAKKDK